MKKLCSNKKAKLPVGGSWAELYDILSDLLNRRNNLLPFVKEFDLIDKALKQYFAGVKECRVGNFQVKGKWEEGQSYKLPASLKQKYITKTKQWAVNIEKIK